MSLRVVVDGVALPDEAGRAFWQRFSAWMEEHPGDLGGFARAEGLVSVHPEMHGGEAVLVASRTVRQGAYTSAPRRPPGPVPGPAGKSRKRPRR